MPNVKEERMLYRKHCINAIGVLILGLGLVTTGCGGIASANQDPPPPPPSRRSAGIAVVHHIIYMLQENRSFDQYFGQLNIYRQSKGLSTEVDVTPATASQLSYDHSITFTPFHMNSQCIEELSSYWNESHNDWNHFAPTTATPLMDGFANSAGGKSRNNNPPRSDIKGLRVFGY